MIINEPFKYRSLSVFDISTILLATHFFLVSTSSNDNVMFSFFFTLIINTIKIITKHNCEVDSKVFLYP